MKPVKKHSSWNPHELIACIVLVLTAIVFLTTAIIGAYADDTTMTLCARLLPFELATGMFISLLTMLLPLPSDKDHAGRDEKKDKNRA